jgi:predicted transposase YbfD/YdcC
MTQTKRTTIHESFTALEDPRQEGKVEHPLVNVIFLTICGVLCGADNWTEIESFGYAQREWLGTYLDLTHGIPAHDTLGRVFSQLDGASFSDCFVVWMSSLAEQQGKQIAIDGKVMCGSRDKGLGREAIDMVSAFAVEAGLTLAQRQVDEKSNEITAIPFLLELLVLEGTVVTIDAIGCQTDITEQIIDGGGDYILALKGNQGQLQEDVMEMFAYFERTAFRDVAHSYHRQVNSGHGRLEIRECWVFSPHEYAPSFRTLDKWQGLRSAVVVRSERRLGHKTEMEQRFFISSLTENAQTHLNYIRGHWGIENRLHWVLDVAFREDHHRARQGQSAANLAIVRHIVLNLLRRDHSFKGGIHAKRLRCAWNADYRLHVLEQLFSVN